MKHVPHNALWNLAGNGLPLLIGLITIPALLFGLGAERFGLLTLVWATLGYFSLFDLGIGRATTRYVAEYWADGREVMAARLLRVGLLVLGGLGVSGGGLLAGMAAKIPSLLIFSADLPRSEIVQSIYVVAVSLPVVLLTAGLRGALEGMERFRLVNLIKIPANVAIFVIPVAMLPFTTRLDMMVAGIAASRLIFLLVYAWGVRQLLAMEYEGGWRSDAGLLRQLLGYGGWIFLAASLGSLMSMGYLDRMLIGNMLSVADIAYYATPMEIVLRILIIPGAIVAAMFPALAKVPASGPDAQRLCEGGFKAIVLLMLPLVLFVLAIGKDLLGLWINGEFASRAATTLHFLVVGVFFNALAHVPYTALQASGRPGVTAMRHVAELPFYLPLLWVLLRIYGVNGAAMAWALWAVTDMALLFWLKQKKLAVPFAEVRHPWRVLVGIMVSFTLAFLLSLAPTFEMRILGVIALCLAVGMVGWGYFLDAGDKNAVIRILAKAW